MGVNLLAGTIVAEPVPLSGRAPRIAVFDSGVGGLTVFQTIREALPGAELIYCADDAAFPYGALSDDVLTARVADVVGALIGSVQPDIVVIACNTASTLALPVLRAQHAIPFVGTVPAIKPAAAQSRSRMISVLATPGTVRRDYTRDLIAEHAADCQVTLTGAAELAAMAEAELRGMPVSDDAIRAAIAPCFVEAGARRTDTVVLACTHFPLLLERFKALAPWPVDWIDPAPAIARRVAALAGVYDTGAAPGPASVWFTGQGASSLHPALAARGFGKARVLPAGEVPSC